MARGVLCPSCGNIAPATSVDCPECGAPLDGTHHDVTVLRRTDAGEATVMGISTLDADDPEPTVAPPNTAKTKPFQPFNPSRSDARTTLFTPFTGAPTDTSEDEGVTATGTVMKPLKLPQLTPVLPPPPPAPPPPAASGAQIVKRTTSGERRPAVPFSAPAQPSPRRPQAHTQPLVPASFEVLMGDLVGQHVGEYVVEEKVGMGGMGAVYRARHPLIGTNVAIKVLRSDVMVDKRDMQRFLDEARVVNGIKHRGIISIFNAGELEDGRQYLVMEYLEGETLEKRLERDKKLPFDVVAPILLDVAAALAAAHGANVVHRDLKPANVFLVKQSDGETWVKLLDFGLARRANQELSRIAGTPDYISPEHAIGKPAGPPSDVYALGILLFHTMTGQLPFKGPTAMQVMEQHVHQRPPVPAAWEPSIPPEVSTFILSLLEKDPAKRPTAQAAYDRLSELVGTLSQRGPDPSATYEPEPTPIVPELDPRLERRAKAADAKPGRANALMLAVAGLALAVLLGVLAWVAFGESPDGPSEPMPVTPPQDELLAPPGEPEVAPPPVEQVKPAVPTPAPAPPHRR